MATTEGKAPKPATKAVSATISEANYKIIDEYHWTARKNLSQVIDQAVTEFIANHKLAESK